MVFEVQGMRAAWALMNLQIFLLPSETVRTVYLRIPGLDENFVFKRVALGLRFPN